jgi:hypothetical protein
LFPVLLIEEVLHVAFLHGKAVIFFIFAANPILFRAFKFLTGLLPFLCHAAGAAFPEAGYIHQFFPLKKSDGLKDHTALDLFSKLIFPLIGLIYREVFKGAKLLARDFLK